eukprot:755803-Prymnesium_polylepis.1
MNAAPPRIAPGEPRFHGQLQHVRDCLEQAVLRLSSATSTIPRTTERMRWELTTLRVASPSLRRACTKIILFHRLSENRGRAQRSTG